MLGRKVSLSLALSLWNGQVWAYRESRGEDFERISAWVPWADRQVVVVLWSLSADTIQLLTKGSSKILNLKSQVFVPFVPLFAPCGLEKRG